MVKLLDCTTRDGGFTSNWEFEEYFVLNLIECLNKSKIDYYEIGYRNHNNNEGKGDFYRCDKNLLANFYKNKGEVELGVMVDAKRYNANDFINAQNDYIDFVRIACHPQDIAQALEIAENLHHKGYKVFVQLMEALKIDTIGYIQLFQWTKKDILESLYVADSYGEMVQNNVEEIFNKLRVIGYKNISFHAHNNSGLALENTIKAIDIGAFSVDITHNGIGRGGNLDATKLLDIINKPMAKNYRNLDNVLLQN